MMLSLLFILCFNSFAADFETEAKSLAEDLKKNLLTNLSQKMTSEGSIPALEFCHINVSVLAKTAAGQRLDRYAFGRTSHKVRNPKNAPEAWMQVYVDEFQLTTSKAPANPRVHIFEDGKKAYLEPLYIGAQCLTCHGTPSKEMSQKITSLYPKDKALGFKLGEFRGMIWVKEK